MRRRRRRSFSKPHPILRQATTITSFGEGLSFRL
jgi:hypothetical protein